MTKNTRKSTLHWFYCDLLLENIYLSQAKDGTILTQELNQGLGLDLTPSNAEIPIGMAFYMPDVGYFIWIPDLPNRKTISKLEILVHESSHVATMIMDRKGIKDDETRAYLVQYIYKNCAKALKN